MRYLCYLLLFLLMSPGLCHTKVFAESCTLRSQGTQRGELVILRGHYASSFEFSGFQSCDDEKHTWWWLSAPNHYAKLSDELKKHGNREFESSAKLKLYVRIKACLSPPGTFGHMGAFPRLLEVRELYEYRLSQESDCESEDSTS